MALNCRDRTAEFFSTADTFRPQIPQSRTHVRRRSSRSQFTDATRQINLGLLDTTAKLQHLTSLARSTSLFNDPTLEIQQLTHIIKKDINTINGEIDVLQSYVSNHHSSTHQADTHTETVVQSLKTKLALTTKEFAEVLAVRTQSLKEQNSRRQQFSNTSKLSTRKRQPLQSDQLPFFHEDNSNSHDNVQSSETQQLLQQPGPDQYLRQRAEAVEQIEATIHELSLMYQKLAVIVAEQEEYCIRIDQNVENSLGYIGNVNDKLVQHYGRVSSNRWLIIKIFVVLILFLFFFVIFVM